MNRNTKKCIKSRPSAASAAVVAPRAARPAPSCACLRRLDQVLLQPRHVRVALAVLLGHHVVLRVGLPRLAALEVEVVGERAHDAVLVHDALAEVDRGSPRCTSGTPARFPPAPRLPTPSRAAAPRPRPTAAATPRAPCDTAAAC